MPPDVAAPGALRRSIVHVGVFTVAVAPLLVVGAGGDEVGGGDGNDTLFGNDGADDLRGSTGTDRAYGGPGADECVTETRVTCEA